MDTTLMSTALRKPKSITLTAHASPTQTVTLTLVCITLELQKIPATDQSQWILIVEDTRGLAAADWECSAFVDNHGVQRMCLVHNVREVRPGVIAMVKT